MNGHRDVSAVIPGGLLDLRRWCHCCLVLLLATLVGCSTDDSWETPAALDRGADADPMPVDLPSTSEGSAHPGPSAEEEAAKAAFEALTSENVAPEEWEAANEKLTEIGKPALPVLLAGLKSDDQIKRQVASQVLVEFGPEAASIADDLVAALDDKSTFVRSNIATTLLQMPEHADGVVPVLSEFLKSDEAELRRMAAMNLAAMETESARPLIPQLISALEDSEREVVFYSVQLLGRIGPDATDALPKLQAIDADGDEELQAAVTEAVRQIDAETDPE